MYLWVNRLLILPQRHCLAASRLLRHRRPTMVSAQALGLNSRAANTVRLSRIAVLLWPGLKMSAST